MEQPIPQNLGSDIVATAWQSVVNIQLKPRSPMEEAPFAISHTHSHHGKYETTGQTMPNGNSVVGQEVINQELASPTQPRSPLEQPHQASDTVGQYFQKTVAIRRPEKLNGPLDEDFKFAKAPAMNMNIARSRGPTFATHNASAALALSTVPDPVKDPMLDSKHKDAVDCISHADSHQPYSPKFQTPKNASEEVPVPTPGSPSQPANAKPVSYTETSRNTPIAVGPNEHLTQADGQNPLCPQFNGHSDINETEAATPKVVWDSVEQDGASTMLEIGKQSNADCHHEDTDMSDEHTLVDVVTSPRVADTHDLLSTGSDSDRNGTNHDIDCRTSGATVIEKHAAVQESLAAAPAGSQIIAGDCSLQIEKLQHAAPKDLMDALAAQFQRQQADRERLATQEKARLQSIQDGEMLCKALSDELQESEARVAFQESELTKCRELNTNWRERVKKLVKFVNGLTNDHGRLRDVAQTICKDQQALRREKDAMDASLKDVSATLERQRTEYMRLLLQARHETQSVQQALNTRNLDLLKESSRLWAEQDRSARLEEILARSTSSHETIAARLSQQEIAIASRIQALCDRIQTTEVSSPAGNDDLTSKLRECLELLKESREDAKVSPDYVRQLQLLMTENSAKISLVTTECGNSAEAAAQLGSRLATLYDDQMQKVVSAVQSGQLSHKQIEELQETKARIAEKLSTTETALAHSRMKATSLGNHEQAHLQKISALEAEVNVLRNQPHESPLLALRLHDAEKECMALKEQLNICQIQVDTTKADIETRRSEVSGLYEQLKAAKAELTERQAQVERLSTEKGSAEVQAIIDQDRIRDDLSKVAQNEISRITGEFRNEIKGLQYEASIAKKAMDAEVNKTECLQAEKMTAMETISRLESSINEIQELAKLNENITSRLEQAEAARQVVDKDVQLKQAQLRDAEGGRQRLETENAGIQENSERMKLLLATANSKLKAQEAQIHEMSKKLEAATRVDSTSSSSSVNPSDRSLSSERQSVTIRDSQAPSQKKSRGILKSGAVIEDSQGQGYPTRQDSGGPLSSDELSRSGPLACMSKEVREMVLAPSSPLTDIQRTSSPVVDGGAMFPVSPSLSQVINAPVSEARRPRGTSHVSPGSHHGNLGLANSWAYNTSVTSTKTRSVTTSLHNQSPYSVSGVTRAFPNALSPSQSSGMQQSDSQTKLQSHNVRKSAGNKRPHPGPQQRGLTGFEHSLKRRRLTSETEKHGLGPTQPSPVESSTRRKSRRTQHNDKYSERFQLELKKGK